MDGIQLTMLQYYQCCAALIYVQLYMYIIAFASYIDLKDVHVVSFIFSQRLCLALRKDILPIWPMPKQMLVEDSKNQSISLSDNLHFKTAASSTILKDAIKRYKALISSSRHGIPKCSLSQAVEINTIVVVLTSENEAVNIDTNYDYELTMSTETKDATIVANSSFGAMYVQGIITCQ